MSSSGSTILQDDQNFLVEIIDWQGNKAVKKTAKPTAPQSRVDRLQNDVLGMDFFAKLVDAYPDLELYMPQVYDSGPNFYVREFIKDEPLTTEDMEPKQAAERLNKLAVLLSAIDCLEPGENVGYTGSSNYQKLEQSIVRWADENLEMGIISEPQAERAKELSKGVSRYLKPRIAHGDMSPYKHAYLRPDGKITLIDYENFTSHAARYFDVAWNYTRLWSFASTTDIPKHFLATFLKLADPAESQEEQLFAIILQRTLGMQYDAYNDAKNKDLHYEHRAKELLEIVLKGEFKTLFS